MTCLQAVSQLGFGSVDLTDYNYAPLKYRTVDVWTRDSSVIIQSRNGQWRSDYSPDEKNLLGDARNLIILLGDKTARNFGVYMLDENTLHAVNAKVFTRKILLANQYLRSIREEPIAMRFYDSNSEQPVERFDYLYASLLNKYPIASEGHFLAHDIAVHLGAIVLPKVFLDHINMKTQHFINYFKTIEAFANQLPQEYDFLAQSLRMTNEREIQRHERRIDVSVGNVTIGNVLRLINYNKQDYKEYIENKALLSMRADTTVTFIRGWIKLAIQNLDKIYNDPKNKDLITIDDYNKLKVQLLDLTDKFVGKIPEPHKQPLSLTTDEYINFIDRRRIALSNWNGQ